MKFSSPFTSNLRPKKYLKVLTTALMILQKRKAVSRRAGRVGRRQEEL